MRFDPDFYSLRTSLQLEPKDSTLFYGNLPKDGMIVAGQCYRLPKSVPATKENGSYWHTPRASAVEEGYDTYLARMQRSTNPKVNTKTRPGNLAQQVSMPQFWPTPTKEDYRRRGPNSRQQGLPEMELGSVQGQLNPTWVELLMGFPPGWSRACPVILEQVTGKKYRVIPCKTVPKGSEM